MARTPKCYLTFHLDMPKCPFHKCLFLPSQVFVRIGPFAEGPLISAVFRTFSGLVFVKRRRLAGLSCVPPRFAHGGLCVALLCVGTSPFDSL